ncbi:MAG TPA: cyclic nucleotide-binding domain-containing protein [Pseudobdellovibrionaceae bacterium]|jgi:response regulator RpfG family c-di-GMP phosphodiesterase
MARNQDKNIFLIVSGNSSRITVMSDTLNKNFPNCSIFHATDWFDTKYKIDNVFPKIVFVDEYLPKSSGLEVVAKIYKEKNYSDLHIVILSVIVDSELYPPNGRIHYLTEPEREASVVECVSRIVAPKETAKVPEYTLKHLEPGELLFKEGDSPSTVYIVKNGTLKAYSDTLACGRVILGEISAGEFVGEMGHFNNEPRSATIEALTEVDVVEIPMSNLDSVIFSKPSWARALVKTLSQRLKRANKVLTG